MKKMILALSLIIASATSFSVLAQNPNQNGKPAKELKCCKKDSVKGLHKHHNRGLKRDSNFLFKGITLTADQQAKIKDLKDQNRMKAKERKEAMKADKKAEREAYNKALESILTPEQMAVYKDNVKNMKERREAQAKKMKARRMEGAKTRMPRERNIESNTAK